MKYVLIILLSFTYSVVNTINAKNILILHSSHNGLLWTDEINKGVRSVFDTTENATLFIEYLDARRFSQEIYFQNNANFILNKYKSFPPDVIICTDNPAMEFILKLKNKKAFPYITLISTGISRVEIYDTTLQNAYFIETYDFFKERVEFVKKILPSTRSIYYIIDISKKSLYFKRKMQSLFGKKSDINIKFYEYSNKSNLLKFLKTLSPANDVIDYYAANINSKGYLVNRDQIGTFILEHSPVPVFSNISALIGKGIVGNIDQSDIEQGKLAAQLAYNVLFQNTKPTQKIFAVPSNYILDYNALKKWNINEPKESGNIVIINKPDRIYVKYKMEFFVGVSILIILSIIIIMLLYSRTKSKKYEYSLMLSEQKFKEIAELLPQIVYECDLAGYIKFINKQGIEIFGYNPDEPINQTNIFDLICEYDIVRARKNFELLAKGIKPTNSIFDVKRKNGSIFPLQLHSTVIYEGVFPTGLRGIGIDMTRQKETENELRVAKEKAEQSDKLKSAFLANMSHEIRTPLNSIIGFSNLLTESELSKEEKTEYKRYISNSSEYLLKLINDIVDYSKIEAGQLELIKSEFSLSSLFKELYIYYQSEKERRNKSNIEIICKNLSDNSESYIKADPVRTKQIITNLIDNALKFTEKGKIEFGFEEKGTKILFYVKDTGIGISDASKDLIFNRFYKLHNDGKIYPGSGLGLSICRNLVFLMGGRLWLDSEERKGSSFYFELPLKIISKENSKEPSKQSKIGEIKGIENKSVLIAEDEDSNFEFLAIVLKKAKVKCLRALNGIEAINIAKTKDIDLILMDIQMPEMNGITAINEIKKFKNLPIIAQTAYAMSGEKDKIMQAGCDAYIAKPIDPNLLLDLVSQLLNKD